MLGQIKISLNQGRQYIKDIKNAKVDRNFRGFPLIKKDSIDFVEEICPTDALNSKPLRIDLSKCIFCGKCERILGKDVIEFTNEHRIYADNPEKMIISKCFDYKEFEMNSVIVDKELKKFFKNSLKLRNVSAGGCNGCELELNACTNVNFDMGRFGIDIVASPRHADGLVITGPITENMAKPLEETFDAIPEPKIIILMGTCATSGGVFKNSPKIIRDFLKDKKVHLYIPGCPVHPLTLINGILKLIGR
ncbi:MAG: NADH:ubiquinone oxidoreductase [candidate division WOR-3 bacterium]